MKHRVKSYRSHGMLIAEVLPEGVAWGDARIFLEELGNEF